MFFNDKFNAIIKFACKNDPELALVIEDLQSLLTRRQIQYCKTDVNFFSKSAMRKISFNNYPRSYKGVKYDESMLEVELVRDGDYKIKYVLTVSNINERWVNKLENINGAENVNYIGGFDQFRPQDLKEEVKARDLTDVFTLNSSCFNDDGDYKRNKTYSLEFLKLNGKNAFKYTNRNNLNELKGKDPVVLTKLKYVNNKELEKIAKMDKQTSDDCVEL